MPSKQLDTIQSQSHSPVTQTLGFRVKFRGLSRLLNSEGQQEPRLCIFVADTPAPDCQLKYFNFYFRETISYLSSFFEI